MQLANVKDIPFGELNAISRGELQVKWSMSDRKARRAITELRKNGYVICSNSKTNGYYRPNTADEIRHFIADMESRAMDILDTVASAKQYLRELESSYYQPTFDFS